MSNGTSSNANGITIRDLPELGGSINMANVALQRHRFSSNEVNEDDTDRTPGRSFDANGGAHDEQSGSDEDSRPTLDEALGVLEDVSNMTNSIGNLVCRLQMEELQKYLIDPDSQSHNMKPNPLLTNLNPQEGSTQESYSKQTDNVNKPSEDPGPASTVNVEGNMETTHRGTSSNHIHSSRSGEPRASPAKRKRDEGKDQEPSESTNDKSDDVSAAAVTSEAQEINSTSRNEATSQPVLDVVPESSSRCFQLPSPCATPEGPDELSKRLRRMAATLAEIQHLQQLFIAGIRRT